METKRFEAPVEITKGGTHTYCPGCGHGIACRLIFEVLEEMGQMDNQIMVNDVACDAIIYSILDTDFIGGAHGRIVPTACGVKRVRPENLVYAYVGDGATYSIGMQHTIHAAARDENITVIVVNNTVYGMTGGQMSPETLIGQKTTSSVKGRDSKANGNPINVVDLYHNMDIAYLARGSLDSAPNINKTKKYIRKAFEKQMAGEGFTFVEILSPCPTNWNMTPLDAMKRLKEEVAEFYTIGEFIERSKN